MEISANIKIERIKIEITTPDKPIRDIVGFVEIQFLNKLNNPEIKGKGYTIKIKTFKDKPVFTVNAPAYKSGYKYKTSLIIESSSLWKGITEAILKEFSQMTGGKKPEDFLTSSNEEINVDEIPF